MVNAIILAGDSDSSPVKDIANKALIKIRGRYMVEYIIQSLNNANCVNKTIIVGPKAVRLAVEDMVDAVIEPGCSIIQNVSKALDFLDDDKHVIICTCDIPLVSSEAIEDFVNRCINMDVDIGYPIIEKSLNDSKYPDIRRTYVRMKEGIYTGGNIIYMNPAVFMKCSTIAEELVENRKNAVKMGRILGIWTLIKLSMGILSVPNVEKRARRLLGINARAIITQYPEIGNDVDKIDDVEIVNKYINIGA